MPDVVGVAPPGWDKSVERMKKHKDISNPFALAWFLKHSGAHPHKASTEDSDASFDTAALEAYNFARLQGYAHVYVAAAKGEAWAQAQLLDGTRRPVVQERRW